MKSGVPYGTRTRVYGVRGRCPRPLDEGDTRGGTYHLSELLMQFKHNKI